MRTYLREHKMGLQRFAEEHRLRPDWHEPDEQNVSAVVTGCHLDNAMGEDQGSLPPYWQEFVVHLFVDERPELSINLATLLAIAAANDTRQEAR